MKDMVHLKCTQNFGLLNLRQKTFGGMGIVRTVMESSVFLLDVDGHSLLVTGSGGGIPTTNVKKKIDGIHTEGKFHE